MLFPQTFRALPGCPAKIPGCPAQKFDFSGFRRPHPIRWYPDQNSLGLGSFFFAEITKFEHNIQRGRWQNGLSKNTVLNDGFSYWRFLLLLWRVLTFQVVSYSFLSSHWSSKFALSFTTSGNIFVCLLHFGPQSVCARESANRALVIVL